MHGMLVDPGAVLAVLCPVAQPQPRGQPAAARAHAAEDELVDIICLFARMSECCLSGVGSRSWYFWGPECLWVSTCSLLF